MMSAKSSIARGRVVSRGWDTTLFVLGFFFSVLALSNVPGAEDSEGVTDVGVALWLVSIGAWATVFWRRSHPVLVIGAGLILAIIGSDYLVLIIGVHHGLLMWHRQWRWAASLGVTVVVAMFWVREALTPWGDNAVLTLDSDSRGRLIVSGVIAIASLGGLFAWTALVRSQRAADGHRARADAERSHAAQLGEELTRQGERSQIARDIHDGLTNTLALVSMMGGNVEKAVRTGDPGAASLAGELKKQSRNALTELRALVGDLRTGPGATRVEHATMRSVGDLISAAVTAGTKVESRVMLEAPAEASAMLNSAVFRLAQESLTNAVKHAPSETVSLYLDASPVSGVRLRVANALVSRDDHALPSGPGAGLIGMRERVAAVHGTIWTGEHEGEFVVDVTLPWIAAGDNPTANGAVSDTTASVHP